MKIDRRLHSRYRVPADEIFVHGRHSNDVATVKDISEGGLKLEYLGGHFAEDHWSLVDIVAGRRQNVQVSAVRCEVRYDIENLLENRTFTGKDIRSCGLHFVDLSRDQKKSLIRLLGCGEKREGI